MRGRGALVAAVMAAGMVGCASIRGALQPPPRPAPRAAVPPPAPRAPAAEVLTTAATVELIDAKSRVITLRAEDGHRMRFRLGGEVAGLAGMKKGERVRVSYYEAVALRLRTAGDAAPGASVIEEAARARPDDVPEAAAVEVVTVTAAVAAVGPGRRVTLQLPNDEELTLAVRDRRGLGTLKVGDEVEATYREAIVVSVERPAGGERTPPQ